MVIEEAIYAHLTESSQFSDLAGERLYPEHLPQKPTYPAATYRRVSTRREMAHDGPGDLASPTFQFDCYGSTPKEARDLANALRAILNGFQGQMGGDEGVEVDGVFFVSEVSNFGSEAIVHRRSVDFKFVHKE